MMPRARIASALLIHVAAAAAVLARAQEAPQQSLQQSAQPHAHADAEIVTIFGQGQTRQVQNITRDDLQSALPGTNPLRLLEKLPGVNFESADAQGTYEWSMRFSVRGFSQSQLGFTLDGVPLGDMSYASNNGLHISRAIAAENIGRVTISHGAGALGTASTGNLGGTVQFESIDPADTAGISFSQTLGSAHESRTFVRLESGPFAAGTRVSLSAVRQRTDKWKGWGTQALDQVNLNATHAFGPHRLRAFYNHSDRSETDYMDMSLDSTRRLGWDWDYYAPDWQRAVNAARGVFSGGVDNVDDAYFLGRGLRRDSLAGIGLDLHPTDAFGVKTTIYHHGNAGQGHWYTPYSPSSSSVPISIRTTEYAISRSGALASVSWEIGAHTLGAGFWFERSRLGLSRNFYAVAGPDDTDRFLSDPSSTGFRQDFVTDTRQWHAEDSLSLLNDDLKVSAGFKSPKVVTDATTPIGTRAAGSLTASKDFLPQIGFDHALAPGREVFGTWSRNMRAFQPGISGPFSQAQAVFDLGAHSLRPETSATLEAGMRISGTALTGSVAAYHVDFNDRLLVVAACASIVGCSNTFVNVGKVETSGIEAAMVWKLSSRWSWFNAVTYNDSRYRSDYLDNGVTVRASGKQVVDTPKQMFSTELTYRNGQYDAHAGAKYTGRRFYTYLNDGAAPAYWIANISAGMKAGSFAGLKDVSMRVNLDNVFDRRYYSTVGTNDFVASDPAGTYATMLTGAPRQIFVTFSGKL